MGGAVRTGTRDITYVHRVDGRRGEQGEAEEGGGGPSLQCGSDAPTTYRVDSRNIHHVSCFERQLSMVIFPVHARGGKGWDEKVGSEKPLCWWVEGFARGI